METKEENLVRVKIKHGSVKKMEKEFGVCRVTISRAINGTRHNELAYAIRKYAVDLGGDPIFGEISKQKSTSKLNRILAERFKVSTQSIRNARRNITQSDLAVAIRKAAKELDESQHSNMSLPVAHVPTSFLNTEIPALWTLQTDNLSHVVANKQTKRIFFREY